MPASLSRLKFAILNIQSVKNKSAGLIDYVIGSKLDLVALITETWLNVDDVAAKIIATPVGYRLFDHPRPRVSRKGGDTGLLARDNITITKVTATEKSSF